MWSMLMNNLPPSGWATSMNLISSPRYCASRLNSNLLLCVISAARRGSAVVVFTRMFTAEPRRAAGLTQRWNQLLLKTSSPLFLTAAGDSWRSVSDVDVRAGCHTGHGTAKSKKGNRLGTQKLDQRTAFGAIRMKTDVHTVAMVPTPARV